MKNANIVGKSHLPLKIAFGTFCMLLVFLFSGCFTMMYHDEVVEMGRYNYCEKPFDGDNERGHYIGTQDLEGKAYDVFVFKNLIKTDSDKYIKIALPHNDADWNEDSHNSFTVRIPSRKDDTPWRYAANKGASEFQYGKSERVPAEGIVISEGTAEDFSEEKRIATADIKVVYMSTKLLFLDCDFYSKHTKYEFGFFVPQKPVMRFYGKHRSFPTYIFTPLGYPGPIILDIITSPPQLLLWWCFSDFNLGG
ncbi:hypothetical protein [Treponema zioleckii]|uniref:hypothetical protein n=1 Tax=Treponema zioleckii TaxID=331680 RepID=UPI00168BB0F1|nr:hypothetical protein [Treponema zioleckii]